MNKKIKLGLMTLLTAGTVLGGLTSCGGAKDDKKIQFWCTFGSDIRDVIQTQIDEFVRLVAENEGVTLDIELSMQGKYEDVQKKIEGGFSAGNIPTITVAYPDHVANYLMQNEGKYVTNLTTLMDDPEIGFGHDEYLGDVMSEDGETPLYGKEDYVEAFYEEGHHFFREGQYILPYMKSTEVLFYNIEAVQTALDLKYPDDHKDAERYMADIRWDDFMELCKFVMEHKNEIKTSLVNAFNYDNDANFLITKMFQKEINYSSIIQEGAEKGKGHIDYELGEDRTKAEALVKELKEYYDLGLFTTKGITNDYGSDAFINQEVLFTVGSTGGAGHNIPNSDTFTVGTCKVPSSATNEAKDLYVTQGPCLAMLKNPKDSDENSAFKTKYAWKLIKYLTLPENNVTTCVDGSEGYVPVRQSAYQTDAYLDHLSDDTNEYVKSANVVINDIKGRYLYTNVFLGSSLLRTNTGNILTQTLNIPKGTQNIDAEIHKIFQTQIDDAKSMM